MSEREAGQSPSPTPPPPAKRARTADFEPASPPPTVLVQLQPFQAQPQTSDPPGPPGPASASSPWLDLPQPSPVYHDDEGCGGSDVQAADADQTMEAVDTDNVFPFAREHSTPFSKINLNLFHLVRLMFFSIIRSFLLRLFSCCCPHFSLLQLPCFLTLNYACAHRCWTVSTSATSWACLV